MMYKDIQALENAARMAMAGNDDPLPVQQVAIKPVYIGLAALVLTVTAYLMFR